MWSTSLPTGGNVELVPHMMRIDLDEDLWIDDWNDPVVVAASLALAGELDPALLAERLAA